MEYLGCLLVWKIYYTEKKIIIIKKPTQFKLSNRGFGFFLFDMGKVEAERERWAENAPAF
jgi:hypothetical protein